MSAVATDPRAMLEAIHSSAAQALASLPQELPVADVLSPSQTNGFLDCSARWGYKYITKLPDPPGGSFVRGKVVHRIAELYYRMKQAGVQPSDLESITIDPLEDIWEQECVGASFAPEEDQEVLKQQAAALSQLYLEKIACEITPARIEERVYGLIGGVPVQGFVDLQDIAGTVHEIKTASRKPSGISANYALQGATYAQLVPDCGGLVQITTLVATKTPQVIPVQYEVSDADIRLTEIIYPAVRAAMKEGRVLPNRGSNLCSRKHCNFWRECQRDFGGTVKGLGDE
jgi:hypothetical protein